MQHFTQSFTITCSPKDCFAALTKDISLWWSEHTVGLADSEGAIFTVHFDKTFKKMQVAQLTNNHILWRCIDSYLDLEGLENKSEWNATTIEWQFDASETGTKLNVTHVGLNPSLGCYEACEKGWNHFVAVSLIPFLEHGTGQPYKK